MSKMIEFFIEPSELHLHKDFIMRIPSLGKISLLDTYYFWNGSIDTDNYTLISENIKEHLTKSKNTILRLIGKEETLIPIDFSDQYYGVFKVSILDINKYFLQYGTVEKANEVIFYEDNETVSIEIGNQLFEGEFSLAMTKEDIAGSFVLSSVVV